MTIHFGKFNSILPRSLSREEERELRKSLSKIELLQVFIQPGEPAFADITGADGVAGEVAGDWVGDELDWHVVILESVIETVRLGDGHTGIAGVAEDQRRRGDAPGVGDRRLLCVEFRGIALPG